MLTVSGTDAQSFLQNLLTNDVTALATNQSHLSGFCNAKGRLFALFHLIRRQEDYQLILPKEMCLALQQRLTMYILRSKVTITDETENLSCLGLISTDKSPTQALNLAAEAVQQLNDRTLCIASHQKIEGIVSTAKEQHWQLASENIWFIADIDAGYPMIFPETKEKFTPQQVNLELVGGVSFNKGCYPGQEIVARLHYLGKPSRRMFKATQVTKQIPNIGDEIVTDLGDIAGHIVSIQSKEEAHFELLISLKLNQLNAKLLINDSSVIIPNSEIPE